MTPKLTVTRVVRTVTRENAMLSKRCIIIQRTAVEIGRTNRRYSMLCEFSNILG